MLFVNYSCDRSKVINNFMANKLRAQIADNSIPSARFLAVNLTNIGV